MVDLGRMRLYPLSDGFFRLDGGAMFGIVPKALWEKDFPPDGRNRILLGVRPLLIDTGRELILVDTGIGDRWDEKARSIYGIERNPTLFQSLSSYGFEAGDVNVVINTHLHFDHAGGNVVMDEVGRLRPAFPKARYVIQAGEWREALCPNERTRGSYRKEDFLPLKESGQLELIDGDREIVEGIHLMRVSGHNRYMQLVRIESEGRVALFLSDLVPTSGHLRYPYIAAYDLYPLETLRYKREILKEASEERWLLIFEHDPKVSMGYVRITDEGPYLETVEV